MLCAFYYKYQKKNKNIEYTHCIIDSYFSNDIVVYNYKIFKPTFEEIENVYKNSFSDTDIELKNKIDIILKNYLDNNKLIQKNLIINCTFKLIDIEILNNTDNAYVMIQLK
jgi:hypothetical protein